MAGINSIGISIATIQAIIPTGLGDGRGHGIMGAIGVAGGGSPPRPFQLLFFKNYLTTLLKQI
jgi:hypothetical protein